MDAHLPALFATATPGAGLGTPLARAQGSGTVDDPLRIALLVRHVEWADAPADADAQTAAIADVIFGGWEARSEDGLAALLEAADARAREEDAAFSAVVAVLAGPGFSAAAIGDAAAWRWEAGAASAVLRPTLLEIDGAPTSVLTGAVGVGFAAATVQRCHLQLAPGDAVAFALHAGPAHPPPGDAAPVSSPEDALQRLVRGLPRPPALAAALVR